jgi:hypothetical protein
VRGPGASSITWRNLLRRQTPSPPRPSPNDNASVTVGLSLSRPLHRGPYRSLLPHCSLKFRLLNLLQQGLDVAWQGLPQGILVDLF